MARLARLYAENIPQLSQAELAQPLAGAAAPAPARQLDQILDWLREESRKHRVSVHGWVLLDDRITLLSTPEDPRGVPGLMQALGRRMAAGFRVGRVFASRYRSALMQPGAWAVPALIWLESLPVSLGQVDRAEAWPWSSAGIHTGTRTESRSFLTDHEDYWKSGNTPFDRQARYRQALSHGLGSMQRQRIEAALFGQWALGEPDFLERLARQATRRIAPASRGRPRKTVAPE